MSACSSARTVGRMQKLIAIAFTLTVNLLLAACGDDLEPTDELDAGADPTCEPSPDRNVSCRNICRADVELCPGVDDWTLCLEECRAGVAELAWCPGQRGL